jgi:hypothetical protein
MVVEIIIGLIILAIVIITAIKVVKNILVGAILIIAIIFISSLILGSIPSLRSTPIIGPLLPKEPLSASGLISKIRDFFYNLKIMDISRDSDNNLLVTVQNAGKLQVSGFTIFVNNNVVKILNKPTDPLKPGKITTIQTDWKEDFIEIIVKTKEFTAKYMK